MEESGNGHQSCWKGCADSSSNNHVTVRPPEHVDLFNGFLTDISKNLRNEIRLNAIFFSLDFY